MRPPNRRSQAAAVECRLPPSQHFLNRLRGWLRRSRTFYPGFSGRDRHVSTGFSLAIAVRLRPSTVNRRISRRQARLVYGAAEVDRAFVPVFVRFRPKRPSWLTVQSPKIRYVSGAQSAPLCDFGGSITNALFLSHARPTLVASKAMTRWGAEFSKLAKRVALPVR